jgi:hypothetical protein
VIRRARGAQPLNILIAIAFALLGRSAVGGRAGVTYDKWIYHSLS